jgi:hypothetical protein
MHGLTPEPLVFKLDEDGGRIIVNRPLRTIIDPSNVPWGKWVKQDATGRLLTFTPDKGSPVTYKRIGHDAHDYWVCERC